jgi:hypothetical protein
MKLRFHQDQSFRAVSALSSRAMECLSVASLDEISDDPVALRDDSIQFIIDWLRQVVLSA